MKGNRKEVCTSSGKKEVLRETRLTAISRVLSEQHLTKYTKNSEMYRSLRNVRKSQKCTEVSKMFRSIRNVLKKLFCTSKQFKKFRKSDKKHLLNFMLEKPVFSSRIISSFSQMTKKKGLSDDRQTDRRTDRHSDL